MPDEFESKVDEILREHTGLTTNQLRERLQDRAAVETKTFRQEQSLRLQQPPPPPPKIESFEVSLPMRPFAASAQSPRTGDTSRPLEGEWREFTDCDGNTFEVLTRNFTPP